MKHFLFVLFSFGIISCGQNSTPKKDNLIKSSTETNQNPLCSQAEVKKANQPDNPNIIQTCIWRGYKFVKTGNADYKGRYTWEYQVFKILDNNKEVNINNSDIFSVNQNVLLNEINNKINQNIEELKKDELNTECFQNYENHIFTLDEMKINFFQKGFITFEVNFGLGGACMAVDGTEISIPMKEIEKYLK